MLESTSPALDRFFRIRQYSSYALYLKGDRLKKAKGDDPRALARTTELIVKELPDEVLIYDLKSNNAHCLNETAAFVWNHCDGQTTANEIAKLMERKWRTPVREEVIWFTLNKLSRADLMQEQITLPDAQIGMSRRSAVRRLAIGSLLTVPVVMSVVAPTAMAGASIPSQCQTCIKKSNGVQDCPSVCNSILGTCSGNAGCAAAQAKPGCITCVACFSLTDTTISWVAPGANAC